MMRRARRLLDGEPLEQRFYLSATTFVRHDIVVGGVTGPKWVYAADVDGDGDTDVISASGPDNRIGWYENADGDGGFGPQRIISTSPDPPFRNVQNAPRPTVFGGDFDGDGDLDVLVRIKDHRCCGNESGDRIEWYPNIDGRGTFGQRRVVADDSNGAYPVHAADLDSDGDLDIVTSAEWYENTDGRGNFGSARGITEVFAEHGGAVDAVDLDGDGDLDVVTADHLGAGFGKVRWYENRDGRGSFGPENLIAEGLVEPADVQAFDVDGDGDSDVLVSFSYSKQQIVWYENSDGQGNFEVAHIIYDYFEAEAEADDVFGGSNRARVADVDGDGDADIVAAFYGGYGQAGVAWFENADGKGNFLGPSIIAKETEWFNPAIPLDVDGDGDIDVVSAPWKEDRIAWYENRLVGDSNDDGIFNSSDLVRVFQAGKYEDSIPGNATFDEGDWDQDGDFDSGDLVFAFQEGSYTAAASPLANELAAAVDWLFTRENAVKKPRAFVT